MNFQVVGSIDGPLIEIKEHNPKREANKPIYIHMLTTHRKSYIYIYSIHITIWTCQFTKQIIHDTWKQHTSDINIQNGICISISYIRLFLLFIEGTTTSIWNSPTPHPFETAKTSSHPPKTVNSRLARKIGWDTTYSRPLPAITIDTATEIWAAARPATAWHRSNQVMLSLLRPPLSLPTFSDCNSSARLPSAAASVLLSGRLHFWCRLEWISRYNGLKRIGASIAFLQSSLELWCATMKSNHAVSSVMTHKGKEKRPWPSARRWSLLH